jgi:hypothetical protein
MWLLTSVRLHITLTCADCGLDSIMPFADGISQDRYVEVSQTIMLASYTHGKALLCYIGDRFLIHMQTRSSCMYNNIRNCGDIQDFKGENWKDLFDVVVALAAKPNFYTSQRPFRLDIIHNSSFKGEFMLNATSGSVLIQYGCYQEGT